MPRHKKSKCPISTICHCLVVRETNYFECCGHYHAGSETCKGRVNDSKKIRGAKVHWNLHV